MKIGLVGYNSPTGIGNNCRRMFNNFSFDRWLIPEHKFFGFGEKINKGIQLKNYTNVKEFISGLDIIVSYENTWPAGLFATAKTKNIRTVLLCNAERTTANLPAAICADLIISRTIDGLKHLNIIGFGNKSIHIPCPIALKELPYKNKKIAKKIMFSNGLGGVNNRKGLAIIEALNMPITIFDQVSNNKTIVSDLYNDFDLAIQPSLYEGTGLSILEAMACGLPCITTDFAPMNEYINLAYGNCANKLLLKNPELITINNGIQDWTAAISKIDEIKSKIETLLNTDISSLSYQARNYIETFHGEKAWTDLWKAITT